MKLSPLVIASSLVASATAFSPVMNYRRAFVPFRMSATEEETTSSAPESDFGSAMPQPTSAYERLGTTEDKVAIGVDPSEVLQWLGTREDLIERFLQDNKQFDQARAEAEVDKFLMDAEMVQAYIMFQKRKTTEGAQSLRQEAVDNLLDPKTIATYAAWIIGGAGFSYVRKFVVEPKYASGEWEPIHIALPSFGGGADAAAGTADAVQSAVDSVSSSI